MDQISELSAIKSSCSWPQAQGGLDSLNPLNQKVLRQFPEPDQSQTDSEPLALDLPPLYPLQQQIKDEAARFNVLCIGRRAGKTYLSTHLILETVQAGFPAAWFVPDYKVAIEAWRDIVRPLKAIATKVNATERRIELPNGGVVEIWTLENEDAGRGRKYKRVVVDEAAMASRLKEAWEQAIRPTLTDFQGDAWFPSTPKGLNYFYELFQRGVDQAQPEWKSWQLPSSVNPYLPESEIEAIRLELPELAFKQEILAEFLSGDGAVFRNVDTCLTAPATTPDDHKGHLLVAGVDWARQHDFTVLSVICCTCKCEVFLDRFNQIGWDFQRARILSAVEEWGIRDVILETNSIGSPNLEALHYAAPKSVTVHGFETTSKSKPKLIQSLALAFERAFLQWLPDQTARHELIAYEATITESGYTKYSAPEGQWDDTVIARALAWKNAKHRIPIPLTEAEQVEELIPAGWRKGDEPDAGGWQREGWEMGRAWKLGEAKDQFKKIHRNLDDAFDPASPFANTESDFFGEKE